MKSQSLFFARSLTSLLALVLVAILSVEATADLVITGTADITLDDDRFESDQAFIVEFVANQPANDLLSDMNQGLFLGTATLSLLDTSLGVTNLVSTNVNALRQDFFQQGFFLVEDTAPFNSAFSAVLGSTSDVISNANVLAELPSGPLSPNFQGAPIVWEFNNGPTLEINQVSSFELGAATTTAVPEPSAATTLVAGMLLWGVRRRK